jgi:hypothetical protein
VGQYVADIVGTNRRGRGFVGGLRQESGHDPILTEILR